MSIEHGGLPPRSALKRTGRIVQKFELKTFGTRKVCFICFRKVVGLGVDSG